MMYVALTLALALACVAGVQFMYMAFLQGVGHFDKKRLHQLESELKQTRDELAFTHQELETTRQQLMEALHQSGEVWPEIIDS